MSPDTPVDRLRTLSLLQHLPEEKLGELARVLVVQTVQAGDVIRPEAGRVEDGPVVGAVVVCVPQGGS